MAGSTMHETPLQENERSLLEPHDGEIPDLSLGAFRFISVLFAAALVLMIAGAI